MSQIVQMTTEQLRELIESVRSGEAKPKGSFNNCPTVFNGDRDYETVEEFITTVVTYKEVECFSDEDAFKGIPLLFYGFASTWWQGIHQEAKNWNDILDLIREHFAPPKLCYQIYMEMFEQKQDEKTAIDTFVCQKRALLAQLPVDRHDEETQIDLIFGLINIKYRKHIARHDFKTFRELLEKCRIIERNMMEDETSQKGGKGTKRCTYCNFRGHTNKQCRKRKSADDKDE